MPDPGEVIVEVLVPGPQGPSGTGGADMAAIVALVDATKQRSSHSGVQPTSSIDGFAAAVLSILVDTVQNGSGMSLAYDPATKKITFTCTVTPGSGGTTPDQVKTLLRDQLVQGTGMMLTKEASGVTLAANVITVAGRGGNVVLSTNDVSDFVEQLGDEVAKLLERGTHTNLSVSYADAGEGLGSISLSATATVGPDSITSYHLAPSAVGTEEIAAEAVTIGKLSAELQAALATEGALSSTFTYYVQSGIRYVNAATGAVAGTTRGASEKRWFTGRINPSLLGASEYFGNGDAWFDTAYGLLGFVWEGALRRSDWGTAPTLVSPDDLPTAVASPSTMDVTTTSVTAVWAPADRATGYRVYGSSGALLTELGLDARAYTRTFTAASVPDSVAVTVKAVNPLGEGPGTTITMTAAPDTGTPGGITASGLTFNNLFASDDTAGVGSLSKDKEVTEAACYARWGNPLRGATTDLAANPARWRLRRCTGATFTDAGATVISDQIPGGNRAWADLTPAAGTTYSYVLDAYDGVSSAYGTPTPAVVVATKAASVGKRFWRGMSRGRVRSGAAWPIGSGSGSTATPESYWTDPVAPQGFKVQRRYYANKTSFTETHLENLLREVQAAGRVPWVSLRQQDRWADVPGGLLDPQLEILRKVCAKTGIGPVVFSVQHEPSDGGTGNGDQPTADAAWGAMQVYLSNKIAALGILNVTFAPIIDCSFFAVSLTTAIPAAKQVRLSAQVPPALIATLNTNAGMLAGDSYEFWTPGSPAGRTVAKIARFLKWCEDSGLRTAAIGEYGIGSYDGGVDTRSSSGVYFFDPVDPAPSTPDAPSDTVKAARLAAATADMNTQMDELKNLLTAKRKLVAMAVYFTSTGTANSDWTLKGLGTPPATGAQATWGRDGVTVPCVNGTTAHQARLEKFKTMQTALDTPSGNG